MLDLCRLIWRMFTDLFRSRATLEAEILVLRQQINVLRRTRHRRPPFISIDRLILERNDLARLVAVVADNRVLDVHGLAHRRQLAVRAWLAVATPDHVIDLLLSIALGISGRALRS